MFMTKLKIAVVMLLVIGATAGGVLTQARTAAPPVEAKAEDPPQPAGEDKKAAELIIVKVVKPKEGGQPKSFVRASVAQPAQRQQLFSLVSGTIKSVAVDVGDSVKAGQELIRLDAPLVLNEVEQAKASLEMAQARLEEAKATTPRSGVERKVFIAAVKAAEARIRLAQVALDKARIQESFTHLTAEFDGVVAERNCDPGNLVQSGTSGTGKPLLTLVRVDRLRVVISLPSALAGVAERGDPAQLGNAGVIFNGVEKYTTNSGELMGDPKDFLAGRIARISPLADHNGWRSIVVDVPNPNNRLVPGAGVGVQILFNKTRTQGATLLPWQCLVESGGKTYVFTVREGKAQRVAVIIKRKYENGVEITGIQASDLVAVGNQGKLATGTPVKTELIKDWQSLIRR